MSIATTIRLFSYPFIVAGSAGWLYIIVMDKVPARHLCRMLAHLSVAVFLLGVAGFVGIEIRSLQGDYSLLTGGIFAASLIIIASVLWGWLAFLLIHGWRKNGARDTYDET